jgi:hypothetical protein
MTVRRDLLARLEEARQLEPNVDYVSYPPPVAPAPPKARTGRYLLWRVDDLRFPPESDLGENGGLTRRRL